MMDLVDGYLYLGPFSFPEDPDADGPCRCCWHTNALWTIDGSTVWLCGAQKWYWGAPLTWADELDWDDAQTRASMTAEQRAEKAAAAAASEAADEAEAEARRREQYAERQRSRPAVRDFGGMVASPKKSTGPCKWLYCDDTHAHTSASVKKANGWTFDDRGKWMAPLRKSLTGAECWAHEYTDPRTGKRMTPRTCRFLHPGEAGWLPQWDTDRLARATASLPCGGAAGGATRAFVTTPSAHSGW